jgi:hypothetical protein
VAVAWCDAGDAVGDVPLYDDLSVPTIEMI